MSYHDISRPSVPVYTKISEVSDPLLDEGGGYILDENNNQIGTDVIYHNITKPTI